MKNRRFAIESDIIAHIYEDNKNTVHFDYSVDIDGDTTVTLDLFTFNKKNNGIFLLHKTRGKNSIEALNKMYDHIHLEKVNMRSYTVTWNKYADGLNDDGEIEQHVSYFWEKNEEDVINKFFYNKDNPDDYVIDITLNPLS
jgi:hypothetical protein